MLSPDFVLSLDGLPGLDDPRRLVDTLLDSHGGPVSVRFNPFKMHERPGGRQVPWCRYGFYLDARPQFALDPLWHAGVYYVQEAGSMFVEHLWRNTMGSLEEGAKSLRILDLCAAPGGKTTLLSTLAGLDGLVVANETVRSRAAALADNVQRWGLGNVAVTNNDPEHFGGFRDFFDMILVDAPCSGEGMFRKDPDARGQWSPAAVRLCSERQRRIVADAWGALKPGGVMIYSTCTFNRAENEDIIDWIAEELGADPLDPPVDPAWGICRSETSRGMVGWRFYPHRVESEGFFAAALRKPFAKVRPRTPQPRRGPVLVDISGRPARELSRWFGQQQYLCFASAGDNAYAYYKAVYQDIKILSQTLSVVYAGVQAGQLFGDRLRPAHPLALFHDLDREAALCTAVDLETARTILRKHDPAPELFTEGVNLVTYNDFATGWVKRIGRRVNNLYPKELRIMNL